MKKLFFTLLAAGTAFAAGAYENYNQALAAGQKAKGDAAVAACLEAVKLAKSPVERYRAFYTAGYACRGTKAYDKAADFFRKAAAVEKLDAGSRATALYLAGDSCQQQKKDDEALKAYEESAAVTPPSWAAYRSQTRVGDLQLARKNYTEAGKAYKKILDQPAGVDPGSVSLAHLGMARIAVQRDKDTGKAFASLNEAEKVLPAKKAYNGYRCPILLQRGEFLMKGGKCEEAIQTFLAIPAIPACDPSWAAYGYTSAARCAYWHLKDAKRAGELLDQSAGQKSSWGYDKGLHERIKKELNKASKK